MMNQAFSFACLCVLLVGIINANTFVDLNSSLAQDIAQYAVDQMGRGYTLISITSMTKKTNNGIVYDVHMKVAHNRPGGIERRLKCHVKVLVEGWKNTVRLSNCHESN